MKKRIISAVIIAAVFIPVLLIGGKLFAIVMSLLAVMGLHELVKVRETKKEFPFMMKVLAYILVLFFALNDFSSIEFHSTIDYRVMSFIIFVFF